jgi:hypothetical protein
VNVIECICELKYLLKLLLLSYVVHVHIMPLMHLTLQALSDDRLGAARLHALEFPLTLHWNMGRAHFAPRSRAFQRHITWFIGFVSSGITVEGRSCMIDSITRYPLIRSRARTPFFSLSSQQATPLPKQKPPITTTSSNHNTHLPK